jgi:hypothetical protein
MSEGGAALAAPPSLMYAPSHNLAIPHRNNTVRQVSYF